MHCMTRISQQECRGILELREYTFSLGIEARVRRAISSTDVRRRAEHDEPVWYLVPDGVVQYIGKIGRAHV